MSDRSGATLPHADLMDRIYRHQRHVYDLTRRHYLLGRDRLIAELDPPEGGTVLEVACGTGRNLVRAARIYPGATFHGFDISAQMLESAAANRRRAGLSDRIALATGDACDVDPQSLFGVAAFDRIMLSYCLSMIPDWQGALCEAARHLAPGGRLHVVDFGGLTGLPGPVRRAFTAWLDLFHVLPRQGLEAELRALAAASGSVLRLDRPYRDYALIATLTTPGP